MPAPRLRERGYVLLLAMKAARARILRLWALFGLAAGIAALEVLQVIGAPGWALFFAPLLLSIWVGRRPSAYALAAVFSLVMAAAGVLAEPPPGYPAAAVNWALGTGSLMAAAFLVERVRDLSEKSRLLSRVAEMCPASIVITDNKGGITYANPRFTEVTGYTLAEVLGRNPRILKSGATPKEDYKTLWSTIAAGREWHGTFHNRKKNGQLFWESAAVAPHFGCDGRISSLIALKEEITERRQTDQLLEFIAQEGWGGEATRSLSASSNSSGAPYPRTTSS